MSLPDAEPPDMLLVARAASGEEAAFTALFRRYYDRVRAFAYRIALEGQAADDIAQETFIRAARQLGAMRDGQAFVAWIFRIAANVARDHLRAKQSNQRKLDTVAADFRPTTGDENALSDQVRDALANLPVAQREAVSLVFFEDCSHAEAARRLGCAETTVSWRIFLAKRILRQKLIR